MLKIYITNLKKYNEGLLIGEWVDLPISDEELAAVFGRIGIDEEHQEYFISDYESNINGLKVNEYEDINSLNDIAESIEDMNDLDMKIYRALLKNGYDVIDAIDAMSDCTYYDGCYDMEDVAIKYVQDLGLLDEAPAILINYFDYEAFGRQMEIDGEFIFIENGYIEIL